MNQNIGISLSDSTRSLAVVEFRSMPLQGLTVTPPTSSLIAQLKIAEAQESS